MDPDIGRRPPGPLSALQHERLLSALLAVAMSQNVTETRRAVARATAELVASRWGALFLVGEGDAQQLAALHPGDANLGVAVVLPGEGPVGLAAQTRQGQIALADGEPPLLPGVWGAHAVLAVPMLRGEHLLGVIAAVDDTAGRGFGREELHLVRILAAGAAVALENADLHERERDQRQEKNDFVSLVSHEFKTPLTSIKGYAQLAARRLGPDGDANVLRFLDTINAQADKLAALASDMVLYTRLESGQMQMKLRPTDLTILVGAAVDRARSSAEGHAIAFAAEPSTLPLVADPERLQQAVFNLLISAARRMPEGGEIVVGLRAEATKAVVWVRDYGPALAPEQREQVLRRLYHREGAAGVAEGDALALAIAKAIVEAHGGRLWFDGEPGDGTALYFALPLGTKGAQ